MAARTPAHRTYIHTNYLSRQKISRSAGQTRAFPASIAVLGLIAMACFFAFLWVRIYVLEVGYQLSASVARHEELMQEYRRLRIERASLIRPSRIERIARNDLGMDSPTREQIVVLRW